MNGRPLNDEEVSRIEQFGWQIGDTPNLIATIRDRDKTIAEMQAGWDTCKGSYHQTREAYGIVYEQKTNMLSALEQAANRIMWGDPVTACAETKFILDDTIAQVKAITVSKQEESTASEVTCEQPTKDSLHVARRNNPTHPMEHINGLAQEVASDMQWREGEPK